MGSQTLEILRQGVWASITGGWFYDPHQNVFCNTVHLYIWLFLLCLPFTIYLYFPPCVYGWGWCVYCALVSVLFVCVKVLNFALHHMYDTSGCIIVPLDNTAPPEKRRMQKKNREEEDFELQVLSRGRTSTTHQSDNESVDSVFFRKPNSTIDLKVDVHRKNSSDSSAEEGGAVGGSAPPQRSRTRGTSRGSLPPVHPRWSKLRVQTAQSLDRGSQEALRMEICSKTEDAVAVNIDQDTDDFSNVPHNSPIILRNANFPNAEQFLSKFLRELSSRDNSEINISAGPSQKRYFSVYPAESYTKSVSALPQPSQNGHSSGMRRNSNSTMSTIQLPLVSSTAQLVAHVRRHSNVDNTSLGFLPTGSVELGAYMMEKGNKDTGGGKNSSGDGRPSGVRRIKSAALEIGCLPPSVSNLSPHPNSVEAIGGQVLKNPKNAIIPPPSKSLIRNPHLNLWPKPGSSGDANGLPCMNYGSEIVYPIAEISDEMQTSQCQESDLESLSSHCDSDYDDHHAMSMKYQLRVLDSEFHTPRDVNSSDTEFENNGSRSPLLDRNDCLNDVKIVKTKSSDKSDGEHIKKQTNSASKHNSDKLKCDRTNVSSKNIYYSGATACKESEEASSSRNHSEFVNNKQYDCRIGDNSEPTPAKQKASSKIKTFDPSDYFDQTSASSKDFLLEKSSVDSNECLLDNFLRHKHKLELEVDEVKKPPDRETSNSSGSLEMQDARQEIATETSDISDPKTSDTQSKDTSPPLPKSETDSKLQSDENSLYGITWLFEENNASQDEQKYGVEEDSATGTTENVLKSPKASCSNADTSAVSQKNLGAIPKQIKNLSRTRHSSLKENKKKDRHRTPAGPTQEELDTAEAHSAFVQGLECLFAATNANTVVMPPLNREERLRSIQWQADPPSRRDSQKPKKKSIEEMAQTSTNTILPTSMPLLAAFLNSRIEYPNIPIFSPEAESEESEPKTTAGVYYEFHRTKPLMDRNHRNRNRKIKKSNRQRNVEQTQSTSSDKTKEEEKGGEIPNTSSSNVHIATSFEDTTDGAIHCFMDEFGNWMSYTFDKNSSGLAKEAVKSSQNAKPTDTVEPSTSQDNTILDGSCVSITSDITGEVEVSSKSKQGDSVEQGATNGNGSIYNSSSNQGSNNPLLSSNNNSTSMLPISQANSSRSKTIYVMEPAVQPPQRRSPSTGLTETIAERMLDRTERISPYLPSCLRIDPLISNPSTSGFSMPLFRVSIDSDAAKKRFIDSIETTEESHPKSYYKLKIFKCWKVKVTMDRLKLMALFDRNLTLTETILSIFLGIMVSVLGALILHMGFYRDVYAFWFCFVMAGSQYSLLKSVQPDSASPVHGFNRMVAFSRPVYFCLCAAILCIVHHSLQGYDGALEVSEHLTLYGFRVKPKETLQVIEHVISTLLLFFPLAFSLGLFPQVNTFAMYLFEQIDMHIFGGNGTASLSASIYCVFRSLMAVAVLYGFAYGGLTESKGSQHILFSMFCGLVIPISYHLSRSASDYTMVWNLIKNHLIPMDIYNIHSTENSNLELEKQQNMETSNERTQANNKHHSESNISKQQSIGSSTSKVNFSSEANVSKSQKRSQTSVNSSVNSLKGDSTFGAAMNSSGSIKTETQADDGKNSKMKTCTEETAEGEMEDPLPKKLQETVNGRFKNDIIVCSFMAVFIFGIHCTTVFSILQPELNPVVWSISVLLGWVLHYLAPQLRKQLPWLWLASPLLKPKEHAQFEVREPARVMWFEKAYVYLCFLERNILYPVVFISAVTQDSPSIILKFGPGIGSLIVCICALKGVRNAYSDPDSQYLILVFGVLLFRLDYHWASETFLVDYFIMAIIFNKMYEFLLKIQFVVTYIAPWQITWGSAFHAFAQPFSVPHSAMLFLQATISAILSTPLNPVLGSAIFMSSYVRPLKFWERDYNTKRVDQSNTRLSSQLERNLGSDDNNLNSIFYEHLTRSLQHYLCGDLLLGRWGQVQQGDCFVLASDYLNCLVHIVEMGNGLVSFQLRGLEFRGTYCQQREVEAISEGPEDNDGCCCCSVGHLPGMLSVNAMFSLRWLAWQVVTARYVLEGYSITDNSAASMLQMFDFRKVLITYYVKSIIFYTINSPKLEEWLSSASILEALKPTLDKNFIDLDPIFNLNLDEDYDFRSSGITRASFCAVYHEWVTYCGMKREDLYKQKGDKFVARDSALVSLCFGLSLVGRRSLGAASHNTVSSVEFFLYGLHALFKGDFRITCVRDEWVFSDVSLLHSVLAPAVRMALKLHQDHFMSPEEYCSCPLLYAAITCHAASLVICHEASSTWRNNVLRGAPHLLALRHVMDDGNDEYKIIMLNKRPLSFRVIKLNRECVRGLWAGQQQELIYLRNRNPERGSIQNAKQALRNIINSSCDQPIGYPIYVSPLTTSYMDTNQQVTSLVGGALTLSTIKKHTMSLWKKMRRRCGEGCSSGSGSNAIECGISTTTTHLNQTPHHTLDLSRTSLAGTRGSLASVGKPGSSTLASLAGLLGSREQQSAPDLPITGAARLFFEKQESEQSNLPTCTTIKEAGEPRSSVTSEREQQQENVGSSREARQAMSLLPGVESCVSSNIGTSSAASNSGGVVTEVVGRRSKDNRKRPGSVKLGTAAYQEQGPPGRKRRPGRANRNKKSKANSSSPSHPISIPSRDSSSDDLSSVPVGLTIANRGANLKLSSYLDQPRDSHRRRSSDFAGASSREFMCKQHTSEKNIDNITSKDISLRNIESSSEHSVLKRSSESPRELAKATKDLRHDRESYRDLTGKYSELSMKETGLRIAGDPKDPNRKAIVKRSESLKTELKSHISIGCKVVIIDPSGVYDCINLGRRIDVTWPSAYHRQRGGRNSWGNWAPQHGMDGQVVHRWTPNHRDPSLRSHVDKTILLVQIGDRFVPIAENCVQDLGDEV